MLIDAYHKIIRNFPRSLTISHFFSNVQNRLQLTYVNYPVITLNIFVKTIVLIININYNVSQVTNTIHKQYASLKRGSAGVPLYTKVPCLRKGTFFYFRRIHE